MTRRKIHWAAVLAAATLALCWSARAQEARASFPFDDGPDGFMAIAVQSTQVAPDANASVSITREAGDFKAGSGALVYRYQIQPGPIAALYADARIPGDSRSLRFWLRTDRATVFLVSLREQDGSAYQLSFVIAANQWTEVKANLSECILEQGGKDENGTLDAAQVQAVGLLDLASVLVNGPDAVKQLVPNLQGRRSVWLDDLTFSPGRVVQATGLIEEAGRKTLLVDNFETGLVRWSPVRVSFAATPPSFVLFPENVKLEVLAEAAGPGMARTPLEPGGKGLRVTYPRAAGEAYALNRDLDGYDLNGATRLQLSLNCSRKSLLILQVKERDESEYQVTIQPENSVGWQTQSLSFADFKLGDNSKDENDRLDPGQIKEITLLDGSAFAGLEAGETVLELDAVSIVY